MGEFRRLDRQLLHECGSVFWAIHVFDDF